MKKILTLGIMLLFLGTTISPITGINLDKQSDFLSLKGGIIYVGGSGPGNFSTIQAAIDVAIDGDTVFVFDDSSPYFENLVVNKSINLIGEDRDTTEIIHNWEDYFVINITADWVNISGFTISIDYYSDYESWGDIFINSCNNNVSNNVIIGDFQESHGIELSNSVSNNTIIGNTIMNNQIHVYLTNSNNGNSIVNNVFTNNTYFSISLGSSCNNNIIGNYFSQNAHVIHLGYSHNNMIKGNTFEDVSCCVCISLKYSNNNIVEDNNITTNWGYGLKLRSSKNNDIIGNSISTIVTGGGISVGGSINNNISGNSLYNSGLCFDSISYQKNITDNTVNSKPLICLINDSDTEIDYNAGQIILLNCENITIINQNIYNTTYGIQLLNTNNCSIHENNITKNSIGISYRSSSNNIIYDNYFSMNVYNGVVA